MAAANAAAPLRSNTYSRLSGRRGPRALRCWRREEEAESSGRTRACLGGWGRRGKEEGIRKVLIRTGKRGYGRGERREQGAAAEEETRSRAAKRATAKGRRAILQGRTGRETG